MYDVLTHKSNIHIHSNILNSGKICLRKKFKYYKQFLIKLCALVVHFDSLMADALQMPTAFGIFLYCCCCCFFVSIPPCGGLSHNHVQLPLLPPFNEGANVRVRVAAARCSTLIVGLRKLESFAASWEFAKMDI